MACCGQRVGAEGCWVSIDPRQTPGRIVRYRLVRNDPWAAAVEGGAIRIDPVEPRPGTAFCRPSVGHYVQLHAEIARRWIRVRPLVVNALRHYAAHAGRESVMACVRHVGDAYGYGGLAAELLELAALVNRYNTPYLQCGTPYEGEAFVARKMFRLHRVARLFAPAPLMAPPQGGGAEAPPAAPQGGGGGGGGLPSKDKEEADDEDEDVGNDEAAAQQQLLNARAATKADVEAGVDAVRNRIAALQARVAAFLAAHKDYVPLKVVTEANSALQKHLARVAKKGDAFYDNRPVAMNAVMRLEVVAEDAEKAVERSERKHLSAQAEQRNKAAAAAKAQQTQTLKDMEAELAALERDIAQEQDAYPQLNAALADGSTAVDALDATAALGRFRASADGGDRAAFVDAVKTARAQLVRNAARIALHRDEFLPTLAGVDAEIRRIEAALDALSETLAHLSAPAQNGVDAIRGQLAALRGDRLTVARAVPFRVDDARRLRKAVAECDSTARDREASLLFHAFFVYWETRTETLDARIAAMPAAQRTPQVEAARRAVDEPMDAIRQLGERP